MSREVMAMALDAMNQHGSPYLGHIAEYQAAVEALRAELAKPEPVLLADRPNEFGTLHT